MEVCFCHGAIIVALYVFFILSWTCPRPHDAIRHTIETTPSKATDDAFRDDRVLFLRPSYVQVKGGW